MTGVWGSDGVCRHDDLPWWNWAGIHTYNHADIEDAQCLRHPDTGEWWALPAGGEVPPTRCAREHEAIVLRGGGITPPSTYLNAAREQDIVVEMLGVGPVRVTPSVPLGESALIDGVMNQPTPAQGDPRSFADIMRDALAKTQETHYQPATLIVSPGEHGMLRIDEMKRQQSPADREERVRLQAQIADAFGIPHWIAGVEGARMPWRTRLRPRRLLRVGLRWVGDRVNRHMPGVRRSTPYWEGWDPPHDPRVGRWFLQGGPRLHHWRIGTDRPEEDW